MTATDRTRLAAAWFLLQATATVTWWTAMAASERVRGWFEMSDDREVLDAFVLADAVFLVGGSLAVVLALRHGSRWAGVLATAVTGALASATLYLVAWVVNGGDGGWGVPPMVLATVVGGVATLAVSGDRSA